MDLDPAHLRSLAAIVRLGGFHRAAGALHLTQPAVSRHIRRLEEQLGAPLFERRGRGVELTAFGERAAAELADELAAHDRAVARLRHNAPGAGRAFVLGTIENVTDPVLPELLAATRAALGPVEVQLRIDRSLELVGALAIESPTRCRCWSAASPWPRSWPCRWRSRAAAGAGRRSGGWP